MKSNSRSFNVSFNVLCTVLTTFVVSTQLTSAYAADFGVLPYGWFNMDIANKLINQGTTAANSQGATKGTIQLSPDDQKAGYRHIKTTTIDIIAGVYGGWYLSGSTLAETLFGAGAAILPVAGSTHISDRFVKSEKDAENLPALKIPAHADGLKEWQPHDNVFYDSKGGVAFSVGVGYVMTGLSGDYLVQGDWTTYVEKLDGTKVFVKISNVSMNDYDQMAGTQPAYAMLSEFVKNDHFLSYTFDVSDARGAQAYEAMIHGSAKEAQELAQSHPDLATEDLSEEGHTKGHQTKLFMGLPFLNRSKTFGQLYNFADTIIHTDHTKSQVQYGLYWNQSDSVVFSHHKGVSKNFYGVAFQTSPGKDSTESILAGKYGKMNIGYEDDHSSAKTLREDMAKIVAQTGIQAQIVAPLAESNDDLAYTHLNLFVQLSEAATRHLMVKGNNGDFVKMADSQLDVQDDNYSDSLSAAADMQNSLKRMTDADAKHDNVSFVKEYAKFGKAMMKNPQTFNLVMRAAEGAAIDVCLQAEGTKISKLNQKLVSAETNEVFLF
jgi:hypothetical protein